MLLFLIVIRSITFQGQCLPGWVDGGNLGCFYFAKETILSWHDSLAFCQSLGSWLAEVPDQDVQDFLVEEITPFRSMDWWIGASEVRAVSKAARRHF